MGPSSGLSPGERDMLLFMDSFQKYGVNSASQTAAKRTWDTIAGGGVVKDNVGRRGDEGQRALWSSWGSDNYWYKGFTKQVTTIFLSLWIENTGEYPPGYWYGIILKNGTTVNQCCVSFTSDGRVKFSRGYWGSTTIAQSAASTIDLTKGYLLECKIVLSNTVGSVEAKIDGNLVVSATGVNTCATSNEYTTGFQLMAGASCFWYINDLVLWDDTGSQLNSWMGNMEVVCSFPDANGYYSDFTPSAGNNYECVDEDIPSESDTVQGTAANQIDTYSHQNVQSPYSVSVYAVQVVSYINKQSSGSRLFRHVARIGGTNYNGADMSLQDEYAYGTTIWELNPATSAAWTDAIINGGEFGVESRGS